MKILVTGGAGYIGSHTVRLLVDKGCDVVVFDNLSTGHKQALPPQAVLVEGDIRDQARIMACALEHKPDACVHFAGSIISSESVEKPAEYFENNCTGTLNLARALAKAGAKGIVFSSSCSVYGNAPSLPLHEGLPLNPESPYAESKLIAEKMLRWVGQGAGMGVVALRYFNAAGADPEGRIGQDFSPCVHLIPIAVNAAMGKRESMAIYGTDYDTPDGTCVRDYIHICDLARAHVKAIEKIMDGFSGFEAYNCGVGKGYSVKQVIEMVKKVSGRDFKVTTAPARKGDPAALFSDNTKIVSQLGWEPEFGLEQIVSHAWNWHLSHPEGFCM